MLHLISFVLTQFAIQLVSHMMTLMSIASHNQKGHVAPHFNHIDVRNSMELFSMSSASYDANTDASGITW